MAKGKAPNRQAANQHHVMMEKPAKRSIFLLGLVDKTHPKPATNVIPEEINKG